MSGVIGGTEMFSMLFMQSFVSERSIDQDLGCVDRFSCKLDDMIESIQSFGSGICILLLLLLWSCYDDNSD